MYIIPLIFGLSNHQFFRFWLDLGVFGCLGPGPCVTPANETFVKEAILWYKSLYKRTNLTQTNHLVMNKEIRASGTPPPSMRLAPRLYGKLRFRGTWRPSRPINRLCRRWDLDWGGPPGPNRVALLRYTNIGGSQFFWCIFSPLGLRILPQLVLKTRGV